MNSFKKYLKSKGWRMILRIKILKWKYSLLAKIGLCKHEGTMGELGDKMFYCLWCGTEVENEDYKLEQKAIKKFNLE